MSFDSAITRAFSPLISWPLPPGVENLSELASALSALCGSALEPGDEICPDRFKVVPIPVPGPGPDPYSVLPGFDLGVSGYETMGLKIPGKHRESSSVSESGVGLSDPLGQLTPQRSPQLGALVTPRNIQQM
jgi:hypothetical protein